MDAEIRRMHVAFQQQQLRNEAAAERLARGNQDHDRSPNPSPRMPRTIGAIRRLIGTAGA